MSDARASILVVDDHPDNLRTLAAILQGVGYKVRKATSGEMALETVRSQRPDLILLDIRMPGIDGYTVCTKLKAVPETQDIPIIFLSALSDTEDKVKAFNIGGADYITKPFQAEEILVRIRHQLTLQEQQQQLKQQQQQLKQQNYRLQLEMQERQLLGSIIHHIRQSINVDEVLQITVEEVRRLLQIERVMIACFTENDSSQIVAESVSAEFPPVYGQEIDHPSFRHYWQQLSNQHYVSLVCEGESGNLLSSDIHGLTRFQAWGSLACPIHIAGKLWGLLIGHQCETSRRWETWEIDFLQQLAGQLAIAVQQSQLYQQVQYLNANLEQQVRQRTTELQQALSHEITLKNITEKVRDSLEETQILQTVVTELTVALQARGCDVALYDSDTTAYITRYEQRRFSQAATQPELLPLREVPKLAEQVQQHLQFAFCPLSSDPGRYQAAILTCPIAGGATLIGELWLFKPTFAIFTHQEIDLARQVAHQCAIALQQSRLYHRVQEQLSKMQQLQQHQDSFLARVSDDLHA